MSVIDELKEKTSQELALVYLTGSHLTKMSSPSSDYDYYAFSIPTKYEFLTEERGKGNHYQGQEWEAKAFKLDHLFSLLRKTNPNVFELFFQKPKYATNATKPLAGFLYEKRERLVNIDRHRFIMSAVGMMKGNKARIAPDKTYQGDGSFGKEIYNFLKAYRYGLAVAKHDSLEEQVFQSSLELNKSRKLKALTVYDQEIVDELQIDSKIAELAPYTTKEYPKDDTLLQTVADLLPMYK